MADIENRYYQVGDNCVDSQPLISGRRFKLGTALFCGVGLALLYFTAQSASRSTHTPTNFAESTNLVSLSSHLRPPVAGRPHVIHTVGHSQLPGSGPFQKIALTAIKAQNEGKRLRDVAMNANMDKQTKAVMAEVESAVAVKAEDMSGVSAPLGFFDPMGLSTNIPEGKLLYYREAELKHGRVAMLATLGILVGEKFHPFFGVGAIPSTAVFQQTSLNLFWINIAVFSFFFEAVTLDGEGEGRQMKPGYIPGDLQWDPLGLKPKDAKGFKEMQTKELNHGRLAMFASLGMLAQELLNGKQIIDQPPLR